MVDRGGSCSATYTIAGESVSLLERRGGTRGNKVVLSLNRLQRVRSCEAEDSHGGSDDGEPHPD